MNVQSLTNRLSILTDTHKQTLQNISRLSKLPTEPEPGSLDLDEADPRVELSAEIHQSLKDQEEEFELLRQEADDLTSGGTWGTATRRRNSEQRTTLAAQVSRLGEELNLARSHFRKAQLQAKRNAEAAKRRERELLFAGVQDGNGLPNPGRRRGPENLSKDDQLVNASSDVTAGLRRVHQSITAEVSRSQFATDTLQQSTAALTQLSDTYNNLDTLISSSRSLLSSLVHSQKSDTWYLETAFYILCATISWLIFRRFIYGPGWWLVYFPLRLFMRITFSIFATFAGIFGATSSSAALSSAVQSISTSLIVKPSATGGIPRFRSGMAQPSHAVGGGGVGAKMGQGSQTARSEPGSMSEQVGVMAEESPQSGTPRRMDQGTVLRERREDEPPNPKKRMFEEPAQTQTQDKTGRRDEL